MRVEEAADSEYPAILALHKDSFEGELESILVAKLRSDESFDSSLSFVLKENNSLIGHVLFTKLLIKGPNQSTTTALALAPMAIRPDKQKQGFGKILLKEAIKRCAELGHGAIIVLGHPEYYPKFGFTPASKWNIKYPAEVPDEAFLALELIPGYLDNAQGCVEYLKAFSELEDAH